MSTHTRLCRESRGAWTLVQCSVWCMQHCSVQRCTRCMRISSEVCPRTPDFERNLVVRGLWCNAVYGACNIAVCNGAHGACASQVRCVHAHPTLHGISWCVDTGAMQCMVHATLQCATVHTVHAHLM